MSDVLKYNFTNGFSSMREYGALPINGSVIPARGRWVLRDNKGAIVDVDRYRNDMFERHNLVIAGKQFESEGN